MGRGWDPGAEERTLHVPDEAIGSIDNLLTRAQSVQLAHYGGHPARCVEHRLAHLRGKQVQVGVLATLSDRSCCSPLLTQHLLPVRVLGFLWEATLLQWPRPLPSSLHGTHLPAGHILHDDGLLLQVLPKHLQDPAKDGVGGGGQT